MIKGQRARDDCGSPQGDRPERWGASVTGDCQCAWRACSMWCWASEPCTDRSFIEHELDPSTVPDLGSTLQTIAIEPRPQIPP